MKLTILVENSVAMPFLSGVRGGLLGEHGLSVLIEGEMGRWLYDTGRSKGVAAPIWRSVRLPRIPLTA